MTADRLVIGFDKSTEDKACLVVMRKKGRGLETVKQFTGSEALEIYERLTEENVNGVLDKYIYSNHAFFPNEVELFERIEKALGFKLFRWQKTFLTMGAFRQYGETTARILRDLLAVNYSPLDLSTARTPIEKLHRDYYRNIQERLTAAGIPTRTVFYNVVDINRYYSNKRHYGKNTSGVLIDELVAEQAKKMEGNR